MRWTALFVAAGILFACAPAETGPGLDAWQPQDADSGPDPADPGPGDLPGDATPGCLRNADGEGKVGDLGACQVASCLPGGTCGPAPAAEDTPCAAPDACHLAGKCAGGTCRADLLDCSDGNVCTADTCDPVAGCRNLPAAGACDDGRWCTVDDECRDGTCTGEGRPCDDGDPCTADRCDEDLQACADDPATGPACQDGNACTVNDACLAGECRGTGLACDEPPPDTCRDDGTALKRQVPGTCHEGVCDYEVLEVVCTAGCLDGNCREDPCATLACESRGPCYGPGRCVVEGTAGRCVWDLADGAACDDHDPCTDADACTNGTCAGAPVVCNRAPAEACLDDRTLRTWTVPGHCEAADGCVYEPGTRDCPGGCIDGRCGGLPDLVEAGFTPGGVAAMQSGSRTGACAAPGWVEAGRASSTNWTISIGFEP